MSTPRHDVVGRLLPEPHVPRVETPPHNLAQSLVLALGALLFLFPFYYMVIGSLQTIADTSLEGGLPTGGFTLHNYPTSTAREPGGSLLNSGIFTGGVLICTVVFGVLAGYALARLHFRVAAPVRRRCCWCRSCRSSC